MISKSYSNATIFVSFTKLFLSLAFAIFRTRGALYLNDWELLIVESALVAGTASLLNCHKRPDVSE